MSVLDRKTAQLPLPERLQKLRSRIRRQMPLALRLGQIAAAICVLLSCGMLVAIGFAVQAVLNAPVSSSALGLRIGLGVFSVQILLGLAFLVASLGLLFVLHRLYPYYYCQMLKGIHVSDFALLLSSEDIQREMDSAWRERFFGSPLRGRLISLEQHLESSALTFEAIYLYSRHQKWIYAMGRFRHPSRQLSLESLYRWSWVTVLLAILILVSLGTFLLHVSIIYAAVAPQHLICSARLAALLDNYFDTPALDPAGLPELPRDRNYFRRILAPMRVRLPRVPF